MNILKLLLITIFLISLGCSAEERILSSKVEAEELLPLLPLRLEENNIWFELDTKNNLYFYEKDIPIIESIINDLMEEILPRGRSFSPASKQILECYKSFFDENNIEYDLKLVDSSYWIILASGKVMDHVYTANCD